MLNSKFDIYKNEWLDLVFENRNQSYGAYLLRKDYSSTLAKSLLLAVCLSLSIVSLFLVLNRNESGVVPPASKRPDGPLRFVTVTMPLKMPQTPVYSSSPSKPSPQTKVEKVKSVRFTTPRIVPKELAIEEVPVMSELERALIGQETNQSGGSVINNLSSAADEGGEGMLGEDASGNEIFIGVEKYPEFPGGPKAFAEYLQRYLRYPASALENNVSGRVFVSFIVEKDGRLSDINILKGIGFGCDEEAVRVLKKSPLWMPGIQNKQKVRVRYVMPVVFRME